MSTLNAEQAQTLIHLLLPQLEASRRLARMVVESIADDKLAFKPLPEGESLGDLAWYVASASAVLVGGVADARLPPPPAKPQPETVASFLAWDDEQFTVALQRLVNVEAKDLLRPMSFGPTTLPAIEFVPIFLSNLAQHTGMLMAWIAQNGASRHALVAPGPQAGELSEQELAEVAGGVVVTTYTQTNTTTSNGMVVTGTYGVPPPPPPMQITQAGLGSLLGDGSGGYGAVGAVGGLAMFAGIFGSAFASALAVNGALGTGLTVGSIFINVLMRF